MVIDYSRISSFYFFKIWFFFFLTRFLHIGSLTQDTSTSSKAGTSEAPKTSESGTRRNSWQNFCRKIWVRKRWISIWPTKRTTRPCSSRNVKSSSFTASSLQSEGRPFLDGWEICKSLPLIKFQGLLIKLLRIWQFFDFRYVSNGYNISISMLMSNERNIDKFEGLILLM